MSAIRGTSRVPSRDNSQFAFRSLIVGTRGSALAQWQTEFVIAALVRVAPDLNVERRVIKTSGDKDQTRPLADFGGLGVFTTEIENALLGHEIDLAVHSLKDLPTDLREALSIAAIPEREDARDCLVSRHRLGLTQLPRGARVGTSSARRAAQVLALRPDLQIVPLRGNVDTRLRKALSEKYDAVVIAAAGLLRLGRADEITEYLPFEVMLPDPGQGALAVEIRSEDQALAAVVSQIDHAPTRAAAMAERAFLRALGGGCRMPIGAYAEVGAKHSRLEQILGSEPETANASPLHLRGMVARVDGTQIVSREMRGDVSHAEELGKELAEQVLREGAAKILGIGARTTSLRGRRILITRTQEQASALAEKIRALGGEPVEFATIDIAPLEDSSELDAVLARASEFDWIVFTSVNGVRAVEKRLAALGFNPTLFARARLAAIGPATARALEQLGLRVDFIPSKFLGEQIAIELPITPGQSALLLRADIASGSLAQGLADRGVKVADVDAYRTIAPPASSLDIKQLQQAHAVTFTSSSTVRNFVAMLNGNARAALNDLAVFCIGPVTADTARELGLRVDEVAAEHTIDGLVRALVEYYEKA